MKTRVRSILVCTVIMIGLFISTPINVYAEIEPNMVEPQAINTELILKFRGEEVVNQDRDGKLIYFIKENRTMGSTQCRVDILKVNCEVDNNSATIYIDKNREVSRLFIEGEYNILTNGYLQEMDSSPIKIGEILYLPLRNAVEGSSIGAEWVDDIRTVEINKIKGG